MAVPQNIEIAQRLNEVALLLAEQGANPFRVQAYRRAAEIVQRAPHALSEILAREGLDGLKALPGIGESLARSIRDLILTGRLPMLDRLRGEADPVALLSSVPGIGPALAARLYQDLGIHTLEELEAAAHDGRLRDIEGIGPKKLAGIVDSLTARLARVRGQRPASEGEEAPVCELLDVDAEYRREAAAGRLHRVAPHRFNPTHEAWLPVLHTERGPRHYTVLFSNTAHAHQLGKTHDWVILYYDGGGGELQCTVISALRGPLKGHRIVRGRETECERYYEGQSSLVNSHR